MSSVFDQLATVLAEMPGRFGDTAFTDRRRLMALLADRLPEARREIRVLQTAFDDGVFDALTKVRPDHVGLEVDRLAERLDSIHGVQPQLARAVVAACAFALGRGPLPSLAGGGAAPAAGRETSWIGNPQAAAQPTEISWVGGQAANAGGLQPLMGQSGKATPTAAVLPGKSRLPLMLAAAGALALALGGGGLWFALQVKPDPVPAPGPVTPQPQTPPDQPRQPPNAVVDPPPRLPEQPRPPEQQQPPAEQQQPPPADPMPQNFAEELTDFRVPPSQQIQGNLSSPTPTELPGAVGRVTTETMRKLLASPEVNRVVLIDVLNSTTHQTIPGSIMVPGAGNAGSIGDGIQQAFARVLAQLTSDAGSDSYRKPIVVYCASARCWESYNAGLRAIALGYRNVYWYRGGLESWRAAGGRLETSNVVVPLSASGPAPLQQTPPTVPRTPTQQTPPQPPPPNTLPQLIFPDSDRRLISEQETQNLSRDQIRIARNEIFARRGFRFRDQQLLDYFRRFPWYEPRATEVQLNLVEQANVRLLQSVEQRR